MIQIHGIDTAVGLESTSGKESLYLRLLTRFRTQYQSFATRLLEAFDAGRKDESIRMAHDLRSNAGTLGAMNVAHGAESLEVALLTGRDSAEIRELVDQVDAVLVPVLTALQRID